MSIDVQQGGAQRSPLEALILKHSPYQTALFAQGATVIRASMGYPEAEDTLTIAPLRGAMPIIWAADGLTSLEDPAATHYVEVPMGEFTYTGNDDREHTTSPQPHQKMQLLTCGILEVLGNAGMDASKTSLALVDEVQKGGTISTAIQLTQKLTETLGFKSYVRVFAAQDSRRRVVSQDKTDAYKQLASNSLPNTRTTVVPMPLVGTDRASLLDRIVLAGHPNKVINFYENISVVRNERSENLFRSLGSMARLGELRHDPEFRHTLIASQEITDEKAGNMVESWFGKLVDMQDRVAREGAYQSLPTPE